MEHPCSGTGRARFVVVDLVRQQQVAIRYRQLAALDEATVARANRAA
jgi:hypothetical protein